MSFTFEDTDLAEIHIRRRTRGEQEQFEDQHRCRATRPGRLAEAERDEQRERIPGGVIATRPGVGDGRQERHRYDHWKCFNRTSSEWSCHSVGRVVHVPFRVDPFYF
ncbi:hypothetical protein GS944_13590 [Rhodococcus hoagii]|nr:hypothetical protein [Prescottella equi]